MVKKSSFTLLLVILVLMYFAEEVYVNVRAGNDRNPGTGWQIKDFPPGYQNSFLFKRLTETDENEK